MQRGIFCRALMLAVATTATARASSNNIAVSKPSSASSSTHGYESAKAFDGTISSNGSNRWTSEKAQNNRKEWVEVDLGSAYIVDHFELELGKGGSQPYPTQSFNVRVASATASFKDIADTMVRNNTSTHITLTLRQTVTGQRFRFVCQTPGKDGYCRVQEFKVFGTRADNPSPTPNPSNTPAPTPTPFTVNVSDYQPICNGSTHYVREWLTNGPRSKGYKDLRAIEEDYPAVKSLDDQIDFATLSNAFNALPAEGGWIKFKAGMICVLDRPIKIYNRSFDADMTGATIKMADDNFAISKKTAYNAIAITASGSNSLKYVNWHGGSFDGNRDHVDWPGCMRSDTKFIPLSEGGSSEKNAEEWKAHQIEGNNGLLGIQFAKNALVENVDIKNSISDGIVLFDSTVGRIKNSHALNGAPLHFSGSGADYGDSHQATYFKAFQYFRSNEASYQGGKFTVENCTSEGGSFAVMMNTPGTTEPPPPATYLEVLGGTFHNPRQNTIHVEHAPNVFIDGVKSTADATDTNAVINIGNYTEHATIQNTTIEGGQIDFREASHLVEGKVINTKITYGGTEAAVVNATQVYGSHLTAKNGYATTGVRSVENTVVDAFNEIALNSVTTVRGCTIDNSANGGTGLAVYYRKDQNAALSTTKITNVAVGVSSHSNPITIEDSNFGKISENAVKLSQASGPMVISGSTFKDFGSNKNVSSDGRAAIQAEFKDDSNHLEVDSCVFLKSDPNASMDALYLNRPKNTVIWTNNNVPM